MTSNQLSDLCCHQQLLVVLSAISSFSSFFPLFNSASQRPYQVLEHKMSSRGFDRDARYSRDEPSGGRTRSQSPTRDRMRDDRGTFRAFTSFSAKQILMIFTGGGYKKDYRDRDYRERDRDLPYGGRERERGTDDRRRERDYEGYSSRYDKPREKAHDRDREREKERENPNSDPNYRPRREDGYDRSRGQSPYPPRGGRGGAYSRGGGRNFAERNPAYGGPGGDKGGRERDYQSMDRRAIEEGRRRREEERAMGVVYNEDGRVYDPRGASLLFLDFLWRI